MTTLPTLPREYEHLKAAIYRRAHNGLEGQYAGVREVLKEAGLYPGTPEWYDAMSAIDSFLALRRSQRPHEWVQELAASRPELDGYVDVTWLTLARDGWKRHPITNTAFRVKNGKAPGQVRKGENPGVLLALVDWRPVQRGRADEPIVVWAVQPVTASAPIRLQISVKCQVSGVMLGQTS